MKPSLEHISKASNASFQIKQVQKKRFDAPYHYHPELELTLILSSEGKRFVGKQIQDFKAGDLVLIGSNVPHCWQNHRSDLLSEWQESDSNAQALVLHFSAQFLGSEFLNQAECQGIKALMERAQAGLSIVGATAAKTKEALLALPHHQGMERLLQFLQILHELSQGQEDLIPIDPQGSSYPLSTLDLERINKVYAYVIAHYTGEVHLDEVAHLANMTETAFCRYFKKVTQKTFVELVTEFRIKHACDLLRNSSKSMVEICFESGFGNLSHFNKQFKQWMGMPPLQYRKANKTWTKPSVLSQEKPS